MNINIENLTLEHMWVLVVSITIATGILYIFLKKNIELGFKALLTWNPDKISALHKEHGQIKTVFWTFALVLVVSHILHLIVLWVGTILWTLGIWSPL